MATDVKNIAEWLEDEKAYSFSRARDSHGILEI